MRRFLPLLFLIALCGALFISLGVIQDRQIPTLEKTDVTLPDDIAEFPRGRAFAINIFASWCAPCRVEAPFINELAKSGVPIIGINLRDAPQEAEKFLDDFGNPFEAIIADQSGRFMVTLGATGIPETLLVDAGGVVRYRFAGPINRAALEKEILPMWEEIK